MPVLDTQRIATAGLAVLDERGPKAFTMRAVAEALGVSTMSLYHHVADKAELARLVVEHAMAETPLPEPTGSTWRDDLLEMARWVRGAHRAHPGLTSLQQEHGVWTPAMFALYERWVSLWQQSRLAPDAAMTAANTSCGAVIGAVNVETLQQTAKPIDPSDLSWLPNTRAAIKTQTNADADFDLVVEALIDGLHARLSNRPVVSG